MRWTNWTRKSPEFFNILKLFYVILYVFQTTNPFIFINLLSKIRKPLKKLQQTFIIFMLLTHPRSSLGLTFIAFILVLPSSPPGQLWRIIRKRIDVAVQVRRGWSLAHHWSLSYTCHVKNHSPNCPPGLFFVGFLLFSHFFVSFLTPLGQSPHI
jgi:hypothetical protein